MFLGLRGRVLFDVFPGLRGTAFSATTSSSLVPVSIVLATVPGCASDRTSIFDVHARTSLLLTDVRAIPILSRPTHRSETAATPVLDIQACADLWCVHIRSIAIASRLGHLLLSSWTLAQRWRRRDVLARSRELRRLIVLGLACGWLRSLITTIVTASVFVYLQADLLTTTIMPKLRGTRIALRWSGRYVYSLLAQTRRLTIDKRDLPNF